MHIVAKTPPTRFEAKCKQCGFKIFNDQERIDAEEAIVLHDGYDYRGQQGLPKDYPFLRMTARTASEIFKKYYGWGEGKFGKAFCPECIEEAF